MIHYLYLPDIKTHISLYFIFTGSVLFCCRGGLTFTYHREFTVTMKHIIASLRFQGSVDQFVINVMKDL